MTVASRSWKTRMSYVIGILTMTCFILIGCSAGNASGHNDKNGDNDIDTGFPHIEGANQINAADIGANQLGFESDGGIATLAIAEGRLMSISSYYHMGIQDRGWSQVDGVSTQLLQALTITKGQRIAFIALIPGPVLHRPDVIEPIDFGPFSGEIDDLDLGSNEILLYTQIGRCKESDTWDCVLEVNEQKVQKIYANRDLPD